MRTRTLEVTKICLFCGTIYHRDRRGHQKGNCEAIPMPMPAVHLTDSEGVEIVGSATTDEVSQVGMSVSGEREE
jgi:hypothetical protein